MAEDDGYIPVQITKGLLLLTPAEYTRALKRGKRQERRDSAAAQVDKKGEEYVRMQERKMKNF